MNRKTLETGRRGREGVERKQSEEELRKQPIKQIQDTCGGKIRRQEGKLNTGQKKPEKPRKHIKLTYSETKQQNQDTSWRLCHFNGHRCSFGSFVAVLLKETHSKRSKETRFVWI